MSSFNEGERGANAKPAGPLLRTLRSAWQGLQKGPTEVNATLYCPWRDVDATVTLIHQGGGVDVTGCSNAPSGEAVRCDKACLLTVDD